jgi:hypothetical protein
MLAHVLKEVVLQADSPKRAFYRLWAEEIGIGYLVRKESGIEGKVMHAENWWRDNEQAALDLYERKLRQKTNPNRKHPRRYTIVSQRP